MSEQASRSQEEVLKESERRSAYGSARFIVRESGAVVISASILTKTGRESRRHSTIVLTRGMAKALVQLIEGKDK